MTARNGMQLDCLACAENTIRETVTKIQSRFMFGVQTRRSDRGEDRENGEPIRIYYSTKNVRIVYQDTEMNV